MLRSCYEVTIKGKNKMLINVFKQCQTKLQRLQIIIKMILK